MGTKNENKSNKNVSTKKKKKTGTRLASKSEVADKKKKVKSRPKLKKYDNNEMDDEIIKVMHDHTSSASRSSLKELKDMLFRTNSNKIRKMKVNEKSKKIENKKKKKNNNNESKQKPTKNPIAKP